MIPPIEDWWHLEPEVGGDLDDARLRAIAVRAYRLRNMSVSESEAFEPHDSETPTLCADTNIMSEVCAVSLHVGCGENCPVLVDVPFDNDSGGVDGGVALAIAHAGRDMLDLVTEVRTLRAVHLNTTEKQVLLAIQYVLDRASRERSREGEERRLGYFLGPYTEAWERLVAAEALLLGKDAAAHRAERVK